MDDVDTSTKSAVANGGTEIMPPTDIPPGRFSVIASPSGASMALFHEADPDESYHHDSEPGLVHWVELHSSDLDIDLVSCLVSSLIFRATRTHQDKARFAGNGHSLVKNRNAGLVRSCGSLWARQYGLSALLRSLEWEPPILRSRA